MPSALPRASDAHRAAPASVWARLAIASEQLWKAALASFRIELLPFLVVGLWACRGRPGLRGLLIGGVAVLYGAVLLALGLEAGYVSRRHALPPLLPALGYAAVGLPVLGRWLLDALERVATPRLGTRESAAVAAGLALLAALALPRDLRERRTERLAERRAAEWLRDQEREPGAVAAGRPRVAYYANEPYVPLPSDPSGGMLRYLRGRGARYVIVDEGKLDEHLGLREARDRGLRLMHRERASGHSAAVFEVLAPPSPASGPPPDES